MILGFGGFVAVWLSFSGFYWVFYGGWCSISVYGLFGLRCM